MADGGRRVMKKYSVNVTSASGVVTEVVVDEEIFFRLKAKDPVAMQTVLKGVSAMQPQPISRRGLISLQPQAIAQLPRTHSSLNSPETSAVRETFAALQSTGEGSRDGDPVAMQTELLKCVSAMQPQPISRRGLISMQPQAIAQLPRTHGSLNSPETSAVRETLEAPESTGEATKDGVNWNIDSQKWLLESYKKHLASPGKWTKISNEMHQLGLLVSAEQCRGKVRSLQQKYDRRKARNSQSGASAKPIEEWLVEAFDQDKARPITTLESTNI